MPPKLPPFCKIYKAMNYSRKVTELVAFSLGMPDSLRGACAIGAVALHRTLSDWGIQAKLVVNIQGALGHVYVLYKPYVLDITATQFGRKKISIVPITKLKSNKNWVKSLHIFNTEDELIEHLIKIRWYPGELPDKNLLSHFQNLV